MRVVFLGTPEFGVPSLRALKEAGYEVVGVFTQPDKPKGRGNKMQQSPVKECALQLGVPVYQPEKIRQAFGGGEGYGVSLRYYEETEPLGTAGSVKMAKDEIKEPFYVLSGDGLTDCDLEGAMRFHREKKALATLVLKRVPVPLAFGVVMTDESSRITRFIEKPGWSRVFSDLVNTGTYILNPEIFDYIPDTGAPEKCPFRSPARRYPGCNQRFLDSGYRCRYSPDR